MRSIRYRTFVSKCPLAKILPVQHCVESPRIFCVGALRLQVREEAKAKSPYAKTNTRTNIKTKTKTNTKTEIDVSTALDPLEGACATLADGYWTYKWCHRRDVIQVGRTTAVHRCPCGSGRRI